MNTIKNLVYLILIALAVVSCTRDYDAPPLPEPIYEGKANITIAELKEKYASATSEAPALIDVDYIIKGYITSSDQSGNIFKQLYIRDETGAINIGVDQNSLYNTYRVGQEIFIELHGFYVVKYGGELQIGDKDANANRISWEAFERKTHLNSWPNEKNAIPVVTKISDFKDNMVNTLIQLDNVAFENGGKNAFTSGPANFTSEVIKDASGKTLEMRTSSYAKFAKELLPKGKGSVVGLLGRYNGTWQFTIRSLDDVFEANDESLTPDNPDPNVETVFNETFGTLSKVNDAWPKIKIGEYTGFDMKSPIKYSSETNIDIRATNSLQAHVWFPTGADGRLVIEGINTSGKSNLSLSYEVASNVYNAGETSNLSNIQVLINGVKANVQSTPVAGPADNNKFYPLTVKDFPVAENVKIEFYVPVADNNFGFRLDNIKITTGDVIVIQPSK